MSTSTNGILAYGYDLGGEDDGWKLQRLSEYGELPPLDWYDPEVDDADFEQAATDALETAEVAGVRVEAYCSGESPLFVLAAKVITVYRGNVETIDWLALDRESVEQDWDGKLAAALSVLGLAPIQPEPRWLLVSYWG